MYVVMDNYDKIYTRNDHSMNMEEAIELLRSLEEIRPFDAPITFAVYQLLTQPVYL